VQVLIYAGAVTVLVLFALMLTRVADLKQNLDGAQKPIGAVAALVLLGAFITMMRETTWPRDPGELTVVPFATIGDALLDRWAVPFELISAVLLVALVGAVVIAMQEERDEGEA
jgi:NADH-quinone oxidoreductase subunit J